MLTSACRPIQRPMPKATLPANGRSSPVRADADGQDARHQQHEQRQQEGHAQQAEFLGQHRKDEVGVGFGQVEQFLDAGAQAHAQHLAAAHRDQRLGELETAVEGVLPRGP